MKKGVVLSSKTTLKTPFLELNKPRIQKTLYFIISLVFCEKLGAVTFKK